MPRLVPAAALLLAAAVARGEDEPSRAPERSDRARHGEDRPWEAGEPRAFVAGRLEAGLHGRALLQGGFGRPHWAWAGVQGATFVTAHTAGVEGALRAALPFLDLQVALRRTRSFDRVLLAPAERHAEAELGGGNARLTVLDADLSGVVPVPGGLAAWELEWVRPIRLDPGAHAFEETWQVAIAPPGAAALRLGFLAGPFRGRARLGPFAEVVRLFGRDETVTRAGGALFVGLGRHLSLAAMGLVPVSGPDRFATFTATYGTLAVRYAFASGDPAPGFP